MKKIVVLMLVGLMVGCASSPEKRAQVAQEESAKLSATKKPLVSYQKYKLEKMAYSDAVANDESKLKVTQQLAQKLESKLSPLLNQWQQQATSGDRLLILKPKVLSLRVISGGARFWAGGFAGDSFISMEIEMVDAASGETIASPVAVRNASALGGAWSIGATDRNLLDYIVDIAHQYLVDNYRHQQ